MKKTSLLYLPLIAIFASCAVLSESESGTSTSIDPGTSSSDPSSSTTSTSSSTEEPDSSSVSSTTSSDPTSSSGFDESQYTIQEFGYNFQRSDFSTSGSTFSANGLDFTSSSMTYLGSLSTSSSNVGIQIGSQNNPQTTPFTVSTTFPDEIIIETIILAVDTATSGSAVYEITLDDYSVSGDFGPDPDAYTYEDLEAYTKTLSFSLTSTASRAMYLDYLYFMAWVPAQSVLVLENTIGAEEELTLKTPGDGVVPAANYTLTSADDYYSSIDLTTSDTTALWNDLHDLVSNYTGVSYGDARYILLYTDQSLDDPLYLYGLYDGVALESNWTPSIMNREHVWPCMRMYINGVTESPNNNTINHMTDLHNLRICTPSVNSSRNNKFYDDTLTATTYFPNISENINDDFRGDVARIIFYMALVNEDLSISENPSDSTNTEMGILSTLIQWNNEDQPDAFEQQRNDRIYMFQGNRNPFIDNPGLVNTLFA